MYHVFCPVYSFFVIVYLLYIAFINGWSRKKIFILIFYTNTSFLGTALLYLLTACKMPKCWDKKGTIADPDHNA